MVTCKLCKSQFDGHGTQGHGCAAAVFERDGEWFVAGHYGSRLYDMMLYKFVKPKRLMDESWCPVPKVQTDPVCDICISVWVRIGRVVLIEGDELCSPTAN